MKLLATVAAAVVVGSTAVASAATGSAEPDAALDPASLTTLGKSATFTTVFPAPLGIEGLTGDHSGNLYSAGRGGANPCPVWRGPGAGGAAGGGGEPPAPRGPARAAVHAPRPPGVARGCQRRAA